MYDCAFRLTRTWIITMLLALEGDKPDEEIIATASAFAPR